MKKAKYPNRLKTIREDRKLSREKLADLAGTIKGQIYKLESGERKLTHPWMVRLALILKCEPADFISEKNDLNVPIVLQGGNLGFIAAIESLLFLLIGKKLIKKKELENVFTDRLKDFHNQPNAAEVIERLIEFLHSSPYESNSPVAQQSPRHHQDQSRIKKS